MPSEWRVGESARLQVGERGKVSRQREQFILNLVKAKENLVQEI